MDDLSNESMRMQEPQQDTRMIRIEVPLRDTAYDCRAVLLLPNRLSKAEAEQVKRIIDASVQPTPAA